MRVLGERSGLRAPRDDLLGDGDGDGDGNGLRAPRPGTLGDGDGDGNGNGNGLRAPRGGPSLLPGERGGFTGLTGPPWRRQGR